ncbi:dephospho-CoA kinase [Haloactinospora alba]|uniref:Dephospho-CoA kinase n=2 Tax=Haloactinospora alba TaxID=405555 RepID=A0A543NIA1_9ACTN|nr:dephospho-CoA kinase [Haloactinospora alba]
MGMLRVGLTGGIGSGKSEVSGCLAAHGALVIDADQIAREVVEPGTPGLDEVVAEFGTDVLTPEGTLDRPKLGEIVFADRERLERLNGIVHPRVGERTEELMEQAPPDAVVVYDVPLLVENELQAMYDVVVVVDTPEDAQIQRVMTNRDMTEEQARARVRAQAPRERRRAAADIVIDNSGGLDDLSRQVADVWERLRKRA